MTAARDAYLTTQVMTATPQKLQLLLIDAAVRSIQLGLRYWEESHDDAACEALNHAQEVVSELLASVGCAKSEISRRLAGLYIFLLRSLTDAQQHRNPQQLADVLRVLLIERETWSMVCEKFGTTQAADLAPVGQGLTSANMAANVQSIPTAATETIPATTGFDSSHAMPVAGPHRRSVPIGFPTRDLPGLSSGISLEA